MAPNKVTTYDRDDPETSISSVNIAVTGDIRSPSRTANAMKYSVLILSGTVFLTATISSTLSAVASFHELSQSPGIQLLSRSVKPIFSFGESDRAMASSSRLELVEEATPEFKLFIQTVQQAVRDRDAQFIRSLVTPKTRFSFGEHRSISYLNPDNADSPFWTQLEQAIGASCLKEGDVVSCTSNKSRDRATFGKQDDKWTMLAFLTNE
jgi:hypothetical protein